MYRIPEARDLILFFSFTHQINVCAQLQIRPKCWPTHGQGEGPRARRCPGSKGRATSWTVRRRGPGAVVVLDRRRTETLAAKPGAGRRGGRTIEGPVVGATIESVQEDTQRGGYPSFGRTEPHPPRVRGLSPSGGGAPKPGVKNSKIDSQSYFFAALDRTRTIRGDTDLENKPAPGASNSPEGPKNSRMHTSSGGSIYALREKREIMTGGSMDDGCVPQDPHHHWGGGDW